MDVCHTQTRYGIYLYIQLICSVCSLSLCRASTEGTLFPTAELVDPVGCSQGVMGYHLYSPLDRDNLLVMYPPISLVQISIRLDDRGRHPDRERCHLILRLLHIHNLPLAPSHTLPHVQPRLRWRHLDPSPLPRMISHINSPAPRRLIPQVRVLRHVMATRIIQQHVHHLTLHLRLYPLWTNYWR